MEGLFRRSGLINYSKVLVIPDLHTPFNHPDAYLFIKTLLHRYTPDIVINIGDEVDNHCISFHKAEPDIAFSPSSELEEAVKELKSYYDLFKGVPVKVVDSNHGSLVYRRQRHEGLPRRVFKDWPDILEAPSNWEWASRFILQTGTNKTLFQHMIKSNALAASKHKGMNTVQGHYHSKMDIQYWRNDTGGIFWGATIGCLIDEHAIAMAYGKEFLDRPILGALIIIRGVPVYEPMIVDKNNRWVHGPKWRKQFSG